MTQNNNSAQLDPLDFSNVSDSELFGKLAFAYYEISVNLEQLYHKSSEKN